MTTSVPQTPAKPSAPTEETTKQTIKETTKETATPAMTSSSIQESKVGAITRNFSSFSIFKNPEMITGIKGLVTIQPLNKGREPGWFIDSDDMETCKWSAQESDFKPGRLKFGIKHMFGRGDKRTEKTGILITAPKFQVVMKSGLLIEDKNNMNRIIGTYQDFVHLYEADRDKPSQERQYNIRVKYLVFILKEDNTPAHENPIVLTLKNLNSVDMDKNHKVFLDQMQRTLSLALGEDHPLLRGIKFTGICVFDCQLAFDCKGMNDTEIVNIASFVQPAMSSPEAAQQSMMELTIPDSYWEPTWKIQDSEAMQRYIMVHSSQDAERLNGRYGVAPGVTLMPEHVNNQNRLSASRDKYGADESFG
jgi:hypothetical protein